MNWKAHIGQSELPALKSLKVEEQRLFLFPFLDFYPIPSVVSLMTFSRRRWQATGNRRQRPQTTPWTDHVIMRVFVCLQITATCRPAPDRTHLSVSAVHDRVVKYVWMFGPDLVKWSAPVADINCFNILTNTRQERVKCFLLTCAVDVHQGDHRVSLIDKLSKLTSCRQSKLSRQLCPVSCFVYFDLRHRTWRFATIATY